MILRKGGKKMYSAIVDQQKRTKSVKLMLRLMLRRDEIFRLPTASREVRVVAGVAWLTMDGEDILLQNGERAWLLAGKDLALVSPLRSAPLILEIFGDNASSSSRMLVTAQRAS
jgi:hypothetical protein